MLRINSSRRDFPWRLWDNLGAEVGEGMLAIGYPLGLSKQATFTNGIVSAMRNLDGYNWIQTDAAVNHGDSGGPLVNTAGEVIGVITMSLRQYSDGTAIEGMNFAVPIDEAKAFIASGLAPSSSRSVQKQPERVVPSPAVMFTGRSPGLPQAQPATTSIIPRCWQPGSWRHTCLLHSVSQNLFFGLFFNP